MTYTRITPAGEEKCSLLNGDGMTVEEMREWLISTCDEQQISSGGCDGCYYRGEFCDSHCIEDCDERVVKVWYNDWTRRKANEVNFVKANPDDAVESEGDAVESDAVNHPNHYTQNGIECIAAIRASMTADGFMDYCKGNVLKYIWRWRDKGGIEDLKKAKVYLEWLIEEAEK